MCTIQYKRMLICSEYNFSCHIFICQKSSDFLLLLDRLFLLLMNRNSDIMPSKTHYHYLY